MSVVSTDYESILRKIVVSSASNTVSVSGPEDNILSAPFLSCRQLWSLYSTLVLLPIIHIYFKFKTHFLSLPGLFMDAFLPVLFPSSLDRIYPASVCANTRSINTTSAYCRVRAEREKLPRLAENV